MNGGAVSDHPISAVHTVRHGLGAEPQSARPGALGDGRAADRVNIHRGVAAASMVGSAATGFGHFLPPLVSDQSANAAVMTAACSTSCTLVEPADGAAIARRDTLRSPASSGIISGSARARKAQAPWLAGSS